MSTPHRKLRLAKEPCGECDGNGCVECQPEVWFACPNHPDHRVQSNGWVPCPTCGADLVMDLENALAHGAAGGSEQPKTQDDTTTEGCAAVTGYVARSVWQHNMHGKIRIIRHYREHGLVWAKCLDWDGKNRLLSCDRLSPHTVTAHSQKGRERSPNNTQD